MSERSLQTIVKGLGMGLRWRMLEATERVVRERSLAGATTRVFSRETGGVLPTGRWLRKSVRRRWSGCWSARVWAEDRPEVVAVGLAGSWVRGEARMDSDVDLVVLTGEPRHYIESEAWVRELGGLRIVTTRAWGPMTERRFALPSGLEVEVGIVPPSWAATDPVDASTRSVVRDGFWVLHDPNGLLARLMEACVSGSGTPC